MEPIVNVTIKLKDLEFSLTADEAKELHDVLSNLLGLKKTENDDLLKLAELIKEKYEGRPVYPVPIPYPYPVPYPQPYRWWEIRWTTDTAKVTAVNETKLLNHGE